MASRTPRPMQGFTLVEAIVVIVILAIISTAVAVFISGPIRSYFDSVVRAELTDAADTALRRISREVRSAVPNTVRVTTAGGSTFLEFVPSVSGGQYALNDGCFTPAGCTGITAFGAGLPGINTANLPGSFLTIYNVYNNAGGDCVAAAYPSVYCGNNRVAITAAAAGATPNTLALTFAQTSFQPNINLSSPGARFQIDQGPVTYVCAPIPGAPDGAGTLTRVSGYVVSAAQPAGAFGVANFNLIANNVSACTLSYADGVLGGEGLVSLSITLTRSNESVNLFHQVHVSNVP